MSEWIYCKDKLPKNSDLYLIAYEDILFGNEKEIAYTVAMFDTESGRWNIKLACLIIAWSSFQKISEN